MRVIAYFPNGAAQLGNELYYMIQLQNKSVLKYRNQDFMVSEVSLINADTSNDSSGMRYTHLLARKDGYTTFELMKFISTHLGLGRLDVHCQGLKDEDGVTEQLVSISGILTAEDIEKFNEKYRDLPRGWLALSAPRYSNSPVTEKSLHGNVFNLCLRNLSASTATKLVTFCAATPDFVFANYYDQQRFGLPDGPYIAHQIGDAIINGDLGLADELYRKSGNFELDFDVAQQSESSYIDKIDVRKLNFFTAAQASYVWNTELSKLIHSNQKLTIIPGHEVHVPVDDHIALPLKLTSPAYTVDQNMSTSARYKSRTGFVSTTIFAESMLPDTDFDGQYSVNLSFFLPTGSYATMLVKQLMEQANLRKAV